MNASDIGRALGKLGAGRKKKMSPAAIRQRKDAAKISARKRKGKTRNNNGNATVGTQDARPARK